MILMLILLYTASFVGVVFAWGWKNAILTNRLLQQELEDLRQEKEDE